MKAILVVFDTLNRRYLQPYGPDAAITPHFARLAARSAVFENAYAGSLPCMPARRDLMTGRLSFPRCAWGPLEPFEESYPRALARQGIYTRLVTDHYHYLEEGGSGYHTKFTTWECVRGQEGDPWKGKVDMPDVSCLEGRKDRFRAQDIVNRANGLALEEYPLHQVFEKGLAFLEENHQADNWLLQLESFSPHEPFYFAPEFGQGYGYDFANEHGMDWPDYVPCTQSPQAVLHTRMCYRGAVTACDHYLGQLLDAMDRLNLWKDTMLVVTTDHGYLLGEHGWWGKSVPPCYNEIAHIPFFLWHPGFPAGAGQRRSELVQWIDIAPTLLAAFGAPPMAQATGQELLALLTGEEAPRKCALFGYFGGHANLTDGRYVYMRAGDESQPVFEYTLAPYRMKEAMPPEVLRQAVLAPGEPWSNGCPVLKLPSRNWGGVDMKAYPTALYDLAVDPSQLTPLDNPEAETRMVRLLRQALARHDAPPELWTRLNLEPFP